MNLIVKYSRLANFIMNEDASNSVILWHLYKEILQRATCLIKRMDILEAKLVWARNDSINTWRIEGNFLQ